MRGSLLSLIRQTLTWFALLAFGVGVAAYTENVGILVAMFVLLIVLIFAVGSKQK